MKPAGDAAPGHEVFVSYKREDQEVAGRLVRALEEATGWKIWWDPELHGGERFGTAIRQAIDDAKCGRVLRRSLRGGREAQS